jgi:hypothetical protein
MSDAAEPTLWELAEQAVISANIRFNHAIADQALSAERHRVAVEEAKALVHATSKAFGAVVVQEAEAAPPPQDTGGRLTGHPIWCTTTQGCSCA